MIKVENVSFRHQEAENWSVANLSLTIPDGQCVLLCGSSGSGKTTVTRLINGLIPHYYEGELEGKTLVNGLDVTTAELYETAKQVGSVFQNPRSQFFCVDTTSEIAFGCENMGMPEVEILNRVDRAAREIRCDHLLDRSIFELSGGEKQRIACASVSALQPQVMVLDEPTSNLDMDAIEDLRRIILNWKSQGKTVIIAEHRLYWLTELCDRVVYMKDGCVELDIPMNTFLEYSQEQITELGLRPLRLDDIQSQSESAYEKKQIILRDFCFSYDREEAIRIPELTLPADGIIAVVGHNGAGKTTFSRCLCGLEKKFKGSVTMDGKNLRRKDLVRVCYMVMQDVNHQLFCDSVEEEIQLGMAEENMEEVPQLLQELDLQELAQRHPMSLSGGQKQRVAIASAILANKSILVFDEPTSGLDHLHMKQTAKTITSLRGRKTVFIVTHDLELIAQCCTHVLHIENGQAASIYRADPAGIRRVRDLFSG